MLRSKFKVTRDKNAFSAPVNPGSVRMICARCKQRVAAADGTIPSLPGVTSGLACGVCLVKHDLVVAVGYSMRSVVCTMLSPLASVVLSRLVA